MRGLLTDKDIEAVFRTIQACLSTEPWAEFWAALALPVFDFSQVGLPARASDAAVWRFCQVEQLVLVTANRNEESPDSLEATIMRENQVDSLPVLTVANAQRLLHSAAYVTQVT